MRKISMVIWVLLGASLMLWSCKSSSKANYGVMGCYSLEEGEKQVSIGQSEKMIFEDLCYINHLELPINRAFKGKQDAFIAMGFNMSLPDFYKGLEADSSFTILEQADFDDGEVLYRKYLLAKANHHLTTTVFIEPKFDHVVVYDVIFKDEAGARSFYADNSKILGKLHCGKQK